MFSASVAQKPTMPVRNGPNNFQNVALSAPGFANTAPEPCVLNAQISSAMPATSKNGADADCSHLIESIPLWMNQKLIAQNTAKHRSWRPLMSSTGNGSPP